MRNLSVRWDQSIPKQVRRTASRWSAPRFGLKANAASFFKWGPGVCTQIVAKGYVVDSGRPNAWGTALSHAHYRCARGRGIVPYGPFSGTLGGECHAKKALPAWRLRCARTTAHRPHADERIRPPAGRRDHDL